MREPEPAVLAVVVHLRTQVEVIKACAMPVKAAERQHSIASSLPFHDLYWVFLIQRTGAAPTSHFFVTEPCAAHVVDAA